MSQETVELTLLLTDAFNRRDVDAAIELFAQEGVWCPAMEALAEGSRTYRGHAELRQYYRDLAEFSEQSRVEWSEVRDLGEQVVALGRIAMRFTSGVELDWEAACLCTWRDGKCLEARTWISHAEALQAAGVANDLAIVHRVRSISRSMTAPQEGPQRQCCPRLVTSAPGDAATPVGSTRRVGVDGAIGRFPGEESCLSLVWAVLDLQINNACNGLKLSEIDRQRLYRLRYEPGESQPEQEEVTARLDSAQGNQSRGEVTAILGRHRSRGNARASPGRSTREPSGLPHARSSSEAAVRSRVRSRSLARGKQAPWFPANQVGRRRTPVFVPFDEPGAMRAGLGLAGTDCG